MSDFNGSLLINAKNFIFLFNSLSQKKCVGVTIVAESAITTEAANGPIE